VYRKEGGGISDLQLLCTTATFTTGSWNRRQNGGGGGRTGGKCTTSDCIDSGMDRLKENSFKTRNSFTRA